MNDPQVILLDHRDPIIASRIKDLQQESYAVESRLINYDRLPYLVQDANGIMTSGEIFIGCLLGNDLAGLMSFEKEDPRSMTICRLVISPSYFSRGFALRLLKFLEEQDPVTRYLYVQTAKKNHPAINLYKKGGFQLIREFSAPDGLKLVRLMKTIGIGS